MQGKACTTSLGSLGLNSGASTLKPCNGSKLLELGQFHFTGAEDLKQLTLQDKNVI